MQIQKHTPDTSHLEALRIGLSHERERLERARSEREKEIRRVWVAQYEKQIADELKYLGITEDSSPPVEMDDDELLAALMNDAQP